MTPKLEMLSTMIKWQRRIEAEAMKIMMLNAGILIQVSPVMWGGGENPYDWAINIYITERGQGSAHINYNHWAEQRPDYLGEWFRREFTNIMGKGYEFPTHKS